MVTRELIHRKLTKLIQYLNELDGIKNYSFNEYLKNYFIKRTTERLLQLIVEVATDINSYLLVEADNPPPKNYYESFILLSRNGILKEDFAEQIAPSTGLRNRLVHEYEAINDEIVYKSIPTALKMYREYIKTIEEYLKNY